MTYWTFKHKPGEDTNENDAKEFVEKAIKLNSAIMQYEYGNQTMGKVTQNWNDALKIKIGDYIFLRGDARIYAVGEVIAPRKKGEVLLNINDIIKRKSHGDYSSGVFSGCVNFDDSETFYEDLTSGIKNDWGQRIDVLSWKYYNLKGIYAKGQDNYVAGSNEFGVIKELKEDAALNFYNELKNIFMGREIEVLESNYNLILTGAPGTGKTFLAKKMALKLIYGKNDEKLLSEEEKEQLKLQYGFVQFHPSYDYTDFVEGLRPEKKEEQQEIGFVLTDGIFMSFCKKAAKPENKDKKFVFIIDEINRGEISKIFGELFFSIDPGYRGENGKIITQYSNLRSEADQFFYVPENVYVIGTMNDIDRSVESMDFAMRRRFAWMEITAEESQRIIDSPAFIEKLNGKIDIQILKNRMNNLNNAIVAKELGLTSAYQIGGAYFKKIELYVEKVSPFEYLWDNHLNVLLSEYLRGMPKAGDHLLSLKEAYNNEK